MKKIELELDAVLVNPEYVRCNKKKLLWDLNLIIDDIESKEKPLPLLFVTYKDTSYQLNIKKFMQELKNESSN